MEWIKCSDSLPDEWKPVYVIGIWEDTTYLIPLNLAYETTKMSKSPVWFDKKNNKFMDSVQPHHEWKYVEDE